MGIRTERFPEYGLTLVLYSGVISTEDVRTHMRELDPADLVLRINYLDPTMDYRVDVAALPELKGIIRAKLRALDQGERAAAAFVSRCANDPAGTFWPNYLKIAEDFPGARASFTSLDEAFDWLGLPDAARQAVTGAVQTQSAAP